MAANNAKPSEKTLSDLAGIWEYNHDKHRASVSPQHLEQLCIKTDNILTNANTPGANKYASDDLFSMIEHVMAHASIVQIGEFMNCFDMASEVYNQLSHIVFGNLSDVNSPTRKVVDQDTDTEVKKLQIEIARLQEQMAQHQNAANSKIKATTELVEKAAHQAQQAAVNTENLLQLNQTFNSSGAPLFASAPNNNPNSSTPNLMNFNQQNTVENNSNAIDQLAKSLNFLVVKSNESKAIAIATDPPFYNKSKHTSLRCYARKPFAMWARKCGVKPRESIQFFCLAFSNEIERGHVDRLAINPDGSPKFNTVLPLVNKIVEELHFDEETAEDLKNIYRAFRAKANVRLDTEFMRCCEARELGWPEEDIATNLSESKYWFGRRLAMNDQLHSYLFAHCKSAEWLNAHSFFDISAQLRELQNLYGNSTKTLASNSSNSKPTNTPVQHMDTTNNILGITDSSTSSPQETVNNISKSCRNDECNASFTPSNPKYYCCSRECVTKYKIKKFGKERVRTRKPKAKAETANNITVPEANNSASTGEVSLTHKFFITPAHIFREGSSVATIIPNSLFDTGASCTIMTTEMMKRLNLEKLLVKDPGPEVLAGDKTVMTGRVGHITLKLSMEDTTKYTTDTFDLKILIYDELNNDFVIGRDAMRIGVRSLFMIPESDTILFNPTLKIIRAFQERKRDLTRTSKVEKMMILPKIEESITNIVPVSVQKSTYIPPEFSENEQFVLNIPLSKTNVRNVEMFAETINNLTTQFMNNVEEFGETSLSDVLTTGGLDGLLDNQKVKISETKIIETNKGPITVGAQLSESMTIRFKKFVDEFKGKVFDHKSLGRTSKECHPEVKPGHKTTSANPKYMPLNPFMRSEAGTLVQKMVDLGVIEETNEPANSSIFIVQKSSGKWRLICDLRRYNDSIQDYVVHLPSPYELINKICQFEMFSYMDFPDAYFQVPLSEESKKLNPIIASVSGQQYNYKFLRMAQGLKISTSWFIGILNEIYAKIADWLVNYLDDSVLGSINDEEVHFKRIKEFVQITHEAGLRLSLPKSVFFATNLNFLNYSLTNGAWSLSDSQRNTINALNTDNLTKNKRESIAAFINHFNRFHTGVSYAARRIRDVSTSPETVKSILENIKRKLIESPALKAVNFTDPLLIYTDASNFDCAGVILQKDKNGNKRIVTCFSKKLPEAMVKKPVHERELYGLQQIAITYKYLLIGNHKKTFFNDSRITLASEKSKAPSLRCLFDTLKSTFTNVEFKYIPTNKNSSDIFTRVNNILSVNGIIPKKKVTFNVVTRAMKNSTPEVQVPEPVNSNDSAQITEIIEDFGPNVENAVPVFQPSPTSKEIPPVPLNISEGDNIPQNLKTKILKIHVNAGCNSAKKILTTFQELGFSLRLQDIVNILKECPRCKDIRNHILPRKSAPGITLSKEVTTQCCIFIDHKQILGTARINELRNSSSDPDYQPPKEKSILTVFEPVSSLVSVYPVSDYTSETVKIGLRQHFMNHGPSKAVVCDNAASFTSLKSWLQEKHGSNLHHTSVYHPSSNLSERAHRGFESVLRAYDTTMQQYNYADWQDTLSQAVITANSLKHSHHKVSAYEVSKNRHQTDIEPVSFYPVGIERKLVDDKFVEKVEKIVKSRLKVVLPIFKKGDNIKVKCPDEPVRYGVVTSTADNQFKMAIRVKFPGQKAVSVNKDNVCIQRNGSTPLEN